MIAVLRATTPDIAIAAAVAVVLIAAAYAIGSRRGVKELKQRLVSLGDRLGADPLPKDPKGVEDALGHVERGDGACR